MEERIKLLEGKFEMLMNQMVKMDQALGAIAQWMLVNKQFLDTLQVKLPQPESQPEKK